MEETTTESRSGPPKAPEWTAWSATVTSTVAMALPRRVEVTAGSCTQGAEPPSAQDSEGSPPVTCRLNFTNDAGGAPDKTMGLFYLQRNENGSWTIVGYLRQYM